MHFSFLMGFFFVCVWLSSKFEWQPSVQQVLRTPLAALDT